MRFTKYNNPSKKHRRRKLSRTDADILAGKALIDDIKAGRKQDLSHYDAISDHLSGKPSRGIL